MNLKKVDFYVLPVSSSLEVGRFICRIIAKVYAEGHTLFVYSATEEEAINLDEQLWTFQEDSFIPHHLIGEGKRPSPVQIGFGNSTPPHCDILFNIAHPVPAFYSLFTRVIEVVSQEGEAKNRSRERFLTYKNAGLPIVTHTLHK